MLAALGDEGVPCTQARGTERRFMVRGERSSCNLSRVTSEAHQEFESMAEYKSPLHQTVMTTATDYWNDSCSVEELTYAIEHGAVGATTNPTIVLGVLKKEAHLWRDRIKHIIADNPTWTEDDVAWKLIEEMAV